jgi:hypothetical protein
MHRRLTHTSMGSRVFFFIHLFGLLYKPFFLYIGKSLRARVIRRPNVVRATLYSFACVRIEGRVSGGLIDSHVSMACFMRCSFEANGEVVVVAGERVGVLARMLVTKVNEAGCLHDSKLPCSVEMARF